MAPARVVLLHCKIVATVRLSSQRVSGPFWLIDGFFSLCVRSKVQSRLSQNFSAVSNHGFASQAQQGAPADAAQQADDDLKEVRLILDWHAKNSLEKYWRDCKAAGTRPNAELGSVEFGLPLESVRHWYANRVQRGWRGRKRS